jgi:hypothetical protein
MHDLDMLAVAIKGSPGGLWLVVQRWLVPPKPPMLLLLMPPRADLARNGTLWALRLPLAQHWLVMAFPPCSLGSSGPKYACALWPGRIH